ncbi:MAG: hypothetical protein QOJ97_188 [Solirubrobacteraceae bacterium]|jgi:hypothetical protein|nr:hypothetical protein [Solirubrobacteraceae bacterium]
MAQDYEADDITELRDLFKAALEDSDQDAASFVAAEAALGVVAFDLKDEMGDIGRVLAAEAQDLKNQLNS